MVQSLLVSIVRHRCDGGALLAAIVAANAWICGSTALGQAIRSSARSPEVRELETDRDAFTPATSTVGTGWTVVETSYSFIDGRAMPATHSYPELLVRFGIAERLELRVGWNLEQGGLGETVSGEGALDPDGMGEFGRESEMLYGAKVAISEQAGLVPRSCAIVQGFTPTGGEAPATDIVAAYAFGWEVRRRMRLESSIRYATEHERTDSFSQWAPSAVVRVPLGDRWNVHAEYFGIYSAGRERELNHAFFSPGMHCLLTPNVELGARVGWGLAETAPPFFVNTGIACRF